MWPDCREGRRIVLVLVNELVKPHGFSWISYLTLLSRDATGVSFSFEERSVTHRSIRSSVRSPVTGFWVVLVFKKNLLPSIEVIEFCRVSRSEACGRTVEKAEGPFRCW